MTSRFARPALRLAAVSLAMHAAIAAAQTAPFKPTVLHRFLGAANTAAPGYNPEVPPIVGADGVLQGTTRNGGGPLFSGTTQNLILGQGTAYRIDPTGAAPFSWQLLGDVSQPTSPLVLGSDGTIYGGSAVSNFNNTSFIGSKPAFYTLKSGVPALLFQPTDGPRGLMAIDEQDRIYAGRAGSAVSCSTTTRVPVYRYAPDGTQTVVVDFCHYAVETGSRGAVRFTKGGVPVAAVWSRGDQALYLLTSIASQAVAHPDDTGDYNGRSVGTLVRIDKAALEEGAANSGLIDADKILVLHDFLRNRDGEPTLAGNRVTGLVEAGEWLYGTSYSNPTTSGTQNSEVFSGTLWRVKKTDPSTFTVLHRFRGTGTVGQDGTPSADGGTPHGPIVLAADGNVYGTTTRDGSSIFTAGNGQVTPMGAGTLYRVVTGSAADRSDDRLEILHRFDLATEGGRPSGLSLGPVADGVQKLYGATFSGGSGETLDGTQSVTGNGTVFSFDVPLPTVAFTTDFTASAATARVGERITLSWATDNATICTAGGDNGGLWSGAQQANGSQVPLSGALSKLGANTFTLRCESTNGGPAVEQTVTVDVQAAPVAVEAGGDSGGGPVAPWLLLPLAGLALAVRRRR